jgi:hypothetical protein
MACPRHLAGSEEVRDRFASTTLQVLYDPGWLLKWVGSLAICIGITIMFYFKPKPKDA